MKEAQPINSWEYEAVFAAAAHTLTARRRYDDAAAVLKACAYLTGGGGQSLSASITMFWFYDPN